MDDALHTALEHVEDFHWGPWWLRCIEFQFGRGTYAVGDQFDWHVHNEIQIEMPLGGAFEFSFESRGYVTTKPGQLFVIPPEVRHKWRCTESGMMLGILLSVVPQADTIDRQVSESLPAGLLKTTLKKAQREAFLNEFALARRTDELKEKRLAAWIYLIVDTILERTFQEPPLPEPVAETESADSRNQRIVSKLMRYIEANISGDLSMERFEQVVGLSGRQIQRLFISATGASCHKYILKRRLEIARQHMIRQPSASIKEVAYSSGFSSPAHFATTFKKAYGVPPSAYHV